MLFYFAFLLYRKTGFSTAQRTLIGPTQKILGAIFDGNILSVLIVCVCNSIHWPLLSIVNARSIKEKPQLTTR